MKCCGRLVLMKELLEKRLEGEGVFKNVVRGFNFVLRQYQKSKVKNQNDK